MSAVAECVPVTETWIEDTETPVSAFLKLRAAAPDEPAFLLESAEQGRVGRFSFIGYRPRKVLRWSLGDPGDPYALVQRELDAVSTRRPEGVELPFGGGAVGMFAYDLVRTVEALGEPNPDELGLPDLALMLTDVLVAFDHLKRSITVVAHPSDDADTARAKVDAIREILAGPLPRPALTAEMAYRTVPELVSNTTREHFEATVAKIIDYIYAGDAFQVVPSQRWSAPTPVSGLSIYRGLRAVNPSPYMYYLDFGDFEIAGASPEPLVTVSGRRVSTTPIAGTRPRGATPQQDAEYARELLADEKERAEHVMLVDLGRNDLGRVCEYGSVKVDDFMVVENYSHVMHIVSNVSGTLRPGVGALDALKAVLPAGTLSGAPKVRAMQIIDEVEPVKRCGYGGAIGWASYGGDLDTCIHIRTAVVKDGTVYVQAGGGTVADANPADEYAESVNKSRALRAAIELAVNQPGWE